MLDSISWIENLSKREKNMYLDETVHASMDTVDALDVVSTGHVR